MLKKIAAIALASMVLISFCSCNGKSTDISNSVSETVGFEADASGFVASRQSVTPLFWKVSSPNGATLWLFGAMVAGDSSFYPLPSEVIAAYNSSSILAVEFDKSSVQNSMDISELNKYIYYQNGETLRESIGEELYNDVLKILNENNFYTPSCEKMIPAYINTIINQIAYEQAGISNQYSVDAYLINAAKQDGKTVSEIASTEYEYGILASLSGELQEEMLKTTVDSYKSGSYSSDLKTVADAWKQGDEALLLKLLLPDNEQLVGVKEEYYRKMYVERSREMTDYCISSLSENETTFVCVGLANILGDHGIIAKLRTAGYTVEKVDYQNQ